MVIEGGSWSSRPVTCQSERVLPWGGQSTRVTDRLMTTDSTSRLAGIRSLFDPVDAMLALIRRCLSTFGPRHLPEIIKHFATFACKKNAKCRKKDIGQK